MRKPLTVEFEVPKAHPGLPRLLQAASKLPNVELIGENGLSVTKKQLLTPGVFEEFFNAMEDVLGARMTQDLIDGFGFSKHKRIKDMDQQELLGVASQIMGSPVFGLLGALGGFEGGR